MFRWPHAPSHEVTHPGAYILTAGTYQKVKLFDTDVKLDLLEETLLGELEAMGWQLQAWAVFPNHYHFVGFSPDSGIDTKEIGRRIHERTARELNRIDGTPGRRVWYRCWDTRLTYSKGYLARLAYVHSNPSKHRLVFDSEDYKWCSARWFASRAERPFYETVLSFKTDKVNVYDDF